MNEWIDFFHINMYQDGENSVTRTGLDEILPRNSMIKGCFSMKQKNLSISYHQRKWMLIQSPLHFYFSSGTYCSTNLQVCPPMANTEIASSQNVISDLVLPIYIYIYYFF